MKFIPIFLVFTSFVVPRFFYGAEIYTLWDVKLQSFLFKNDWNSW